MGHPPVPPPPPGPDPWGQPARPAAPAPGLPPGATAYASWGERVGAVLLDGLLAVAALLVVFAVAGVLGVTLGVASDVLGGLVAGLVGLVGYLGVLVVLILTEAGPYGQTPGKHILGIRVLDTSGQTISKGLAVARYFSTFISALPCYVGFLWPLWDPEKRAFHDMIVNTRVVKATDRAPSLVAIVQAPFTGERPVQAPELPNL